MKTTAIALASFALLAGSLPLAGAASADQRSRVESKRSSVASSHSTRGDHRSGDRSRDTRARDHRRRQQLPAPGQPNRHPNHHFPADYHLIRPGGSALNVPRGFYRDNLSYDPPPSHRRGDHGHPPDGHPPVIAPTYVVLPPVYYDPYSDPLAFGPTRGPEDAVEPVREEPLELEIADPYGVEPGRDPAIYTPRQGPRSYAPPVYDEPRRAPTRYPTAPEPETERATEPQTVRLDIVPADATVWLDDEYLGAASELKGEVVLKPGVYLLEVEHDDLPDQRLFFGVVDQAVDVRVDLGASEPRRRYRVR